MKRETFTFDSFFLLSLSSQHCVHDRKSIYESSLCLNIPGKTQRHLPQLHVVGFVAGDASINPIVKKANETMIRNILNRFVN